MKRTLLLFVFGIVSFACYAQDTLPQLDFTDIDYIRLRNVDKYSKKNSFQSDSVLIYFDKKVYPLSAIDFSEQKINGVSIQSIKIEKDKNVIEAITGKRMKALLIINDDD